MRAIDYLEDSDGDLLIQNGDFVRGFTDDKHIKDIVQSFPGSWKEFPTVGVGIYVYQNSSGKVAELQKNIRLQLEADGYINLNQIVAVQQPDRTFKLSINADRGI